MSGTVYRVTCYDSMLSEAVLKRHGDAFGGSAQPPVIESFTADPVTVSAGSPATLHWQVTGADTVRLDGADVTGLSEKTVAPAATTTWTLTAENPQGAAQASVRVQVTPVIPPPPGDRVVINEFMAANISTLTDSDGEFSDWLELYNPTASSVNLGGFFLTDKAALPQQWALPAVELPPGSWRIVFLSGKDRIDSGGEWHANFKLSK
ncbi:MAG: lamin tail domain-containing protein, partial [Verrucomicrobiaceae bacterium]